MTDTIKPERWDIWYARVKFEDSDMAKNRPVLVIDGDVGFVLSLKITTHGPRKGYPGEYQIVQWKEAGLIAPSVIRISKLLHLPDDSMIKKIGVLQEQDRLRIFMLYELIYKKPMFDVGDSDRIIQ